MIQENGNDGSVRVDKMRMMNDKRMDTYGRKKSLFVWNSGSILKGLL